MDLSNVNFLPRYKRRTGFDLLQEFYIPALANASTYDRIAGYFSSAVLTEASSGFAKFCSSVNTREPLPKFRLIVGARLTEIDEMTILHLDGHDVESEISESLLNTIQEMSGEEDYDFSKDRISGLSWMIQKGILEIKVGICYDPLTKRVKNHNEAEFHSKLGILSDGNNTLSFEGSVNETKRGWIENYESLVVFRSWSGEKDRVNYHQEDFNELWDSIGENPDLGVAIYSFPDAAKRGLLEKFPPRTPNQLDEIDWGKRRRDNLLNAKKISGRWKKSGQTLEPAKPVSSDENSDKWSHQKDAVTWFLDKSHANGVGIFQMATGSGKTRTSIATVKECVSRGLVKKTIFCVPKTLEDQWSKELADHYPERKGTFWWKSGQDDHLRFFNLDHKDSVMIVSHWFVPKLLEFANKKPKAVQHTMIVIDEMHHLGSDKYKEIGIDKSNKESQTLEFLPEMFHPFLLRLGLSATPWSEYDETRNQLVANNFVNSDIDLATLGESWQKELINNKDVFYFGLENGIKKGILCEFDYISLDYTPSAEDFQRRKDAFKKIPPHIPAHLKSKMGMILAAQVFKSSREKIPPFSEWLDQKGSLDRTILFVADKEFGRDLTKELSSRHNIYTFREFFQGEDMNTLRKFAKGELDLLIACHRISEGVDIKTVDTVVLFSSNSSRLETIQRIGRALRISESEPDKRASIIDLIYADGDDSSDKSRKEWLEELSNTRRD